MMDPRRVIERALISEKGTQLRESANQYLFRVPPEANKIQIRQAVEAVFSVRVTGVRTLVYEGKMKRVGARQGRRAGWKKAVVTLAKGQTIAQFEQI